MTERKWRTGEEAAAEATDEELRAQIESAWAYLHKPMEGIGGKPAAWNVMQRAKAELARRHNREMSTDD